MRSFNESLGTIGLKSADPVTKHRTALRIFWSLLGTLLLLALLPAAPAAAATSASAKAHPRVAGTGAAYTAVTPKRLMDTRTSGGHLGPGQSRNLTVTGGTTGVPVTATSVVLNVTATDTTAGSFLTVYPAGTSRPLASNLNWVRGKTIPNLVSVPVGAGGAVTFYNAKGNVDVVADLEGYFSAPATSAGGEVALTPARITDTRPGSGQANAGNTLGTGSTINVQVTGAGGVPAAGVSGAILNVTVTNTSSSSFLTVWPTGVTMPLASNLNWKAGLTIPNRVFVPLGTGGKVSIYNARGAADVIVDVSGYFTDNTATGQLFFPLNPFRIMDTRGSATLGQGGTQTLQIGGSFGVPSGAKAAMLNVTATNTTRGSFLTVYPSTSARPLASDLNWITSRVTIPNLTVATLGTTGAVTFYNAAGSVDVVADIFGYFGAGSGVSVTANPNSVPADGTSTSTLTATVTKADGTPAVGDQVVFTTSGGASCGTISGTSPFTNGSGVSTATYTASSTSGTCTITATEAANNQSGTVTITQTKILNTTAQTPLATVAADGVATTTITTTVTNNGAPVAGDTVNYTKSASVTGSCGTLSAATGTTNASGQVTITYTASGTVGFCTVTGTETADGSSAQTLVTQHGSGTNTSTLTANPTTLSADGTSTSTVTFTVSGTGNGNDPVAFALSGTPSAACGTITAPATTNASGVATATYKASTTAGTCHIAAAEANGGSAHVVDITQTSFNSVTLTANPSTIPADSTTTSTLTATVMNTVTNTPVSGDSVAITLSGCGTGSVSGSPKLTDASGVATFTYTAGAVPSSCTATATEAATSKTGTATITQTLSLASSVTVSTNPSTIPADGTTTSTITATVKNSSGGPVFPDNVTFSGSAGCGTLVPGSANTNPSGKASTTYTASTTAGTCTITATELTSGKSGTGTVTQTAVKNVITLAPPVASLAADGTSTQPLTATVTNKGVGVSGDTVNYTKSASVPGSCGTLSATTGTTNASGVAPAITYTASGSVGFCTVTATETGNGSSSTSVIQQHGSSLGTAVTESANPTTLPANGTSTSVVTATVTGAGNGNDPLYFAVAPANCGTLSSSTATTNGSGVASVTYTSSTTAVAACHVGVIEANGSKVGNVDIAQTAVANLNSVTAVPNAIQGNGTSTSTVTSHVTSGVDGSNVAGDVVNFVVSGTNCGTVSPAVATTDASGNASVTYTSSVNIGGVAHFCTVTATETGTGTAKSVSIDQTA